IYPEYTGTIAREILKLDRVPPLAQLNEKLAPLGLAASTPLGFNNTYALALPSKIARDRNITKLSDLKAHPSLRLGLSQEFIGRADGWPGLKATYGLPWTDLRGLDHGLAYEAVAQGQVDVIDIYSTDAKLGQYQLTVLIDDAAYFPRYDAVLLHTKDLPTRNPKTWTAISALEGRINDAAMQRMNAAAELEKKSFAEVAREFIVSNAAAAPAAATTTTLATPATFPAPTIAAEAKPAAAGNKFWQKLFGADFMRLAGEHVALVFSSLVASVLIGVPLGIVAAKRQRLGSVILGVTGVLQTIPSLALLAILIPLTGSIGLLPAFIALSIYALLPIVRNTYIGVLQVSAGTKQAALSLGMTPSLVMRWIELPLALPTIVAGIKTSAVINVGTATIAAFIGAGGFGERIVTGLALNDNATLLAGALPVAALALLIEWLFTAAERRLLVPLNQHATVR
ncbi:MAG: ABC transporter permease subunit, partial [Aeromicrobium sp.]|nr:ABC transporter permease subunit [Burkholderiales bacterium]